MTDELTTADGRALPRARLRKLPIAVVAVTVVIVLAFAYVLVLHSFRSDGRSQTHAFDIGDTNARGVLKTGGFEITADVVAVDDVKELMTIRLDFTGWPTRVVDDRGLLAEPVKLVINSSEGGQSLPLKVGEPLSAMDVTVALKGQVREYPFDHHDDALAFFFTQIGTKAATQRDIPTITHLRAAVHGFSFNFTAFTQDTVGNALVGASVHISRAGSTVFFAVFIMVLMWALALSAVAIAIMLSYVRHDIGPGVLGFLAALLFAFPGIRTVLPGAPPIGSLNDYLAFFWAESIVAVTVVILTVVFLVRTARSNVQLASQ
jgi:hypothetical protein